MGPVFVAKKIDNRRKGLASQWEGDDYGVVSSSELRQQDRPCWQIEPWT